MMARAVPGERSVGRDSHAPEVRGDEGARPASSSARRRRRRGGAGRRRAAGAVHEGAEPTTAGASSASASADARLGIERASSSDGAGEEERVVADEIMLQERAEVAKGFLEGLLDRYGLEATVDVRLLDDETVELAAQGEGLGVLVGPKGATVAALQDVTRTVVQKRFPNRTGRILVDVAGYRERRVAALRRFAGQVASEVLASGAERALEAMSAADRKVVHDTVATMDGVVSSSRGEEPNRFVVISPAR